MGTPQSAFVPQPIGYNGNIDLDKRQIYKHPDGYIQTEYSMGTGFDPGNNYSVRLPQIVNGKPVSAAQAREHFNNTGEHLGVDYRKPGEAVSAFYKRTDAKSNAIHERQAQFYKEQMEAWRAEVEGRK